MTFRCGHPKTDANSYYLPRRRCKTCHTERANAWRESNRDYYRRWNRIYYRLKVAGFRRTRDRLTLAWRKTSGVSA